MSGEHEPQLGFWQEHRPEALAAAAGVGAATLAAWGLMHYARVQHERAGLVPEVDYRDAADILVTHKLEPTQRQALNHVGAFILLCPGFQGKEIIEQFHEMPRRQVQRALTYLQEHDLVQYRRSHPKAKNSVVPVNFSALPALRWVATKPEEYPEFAGCLEVLQGQSSENS